MFDFAELDLTDAEITSVVGGVGVLHVKYKDWKEADHELVFSEVVSFRCFSPEKRALSHGVRKDSDAFINESCQLSEMDSIAGLFIFSFISAWTDKEVCTVVAKSVNRK